MDITKGGALSAQVSVLGVALIAPELVGAILAETGEEDFPTAEALTVYRAVRELFTSGRAVDPVTVRGIVGKEYDPFLLQAMDLAPSQYAWRAHVELLHVQARMHALRSMAERLMLCTDPDAAADIVGKMSGAACALSARRRAFRALWSARRKNGSTSATGSARSTGGYSRRKVILS